jgi:hypothetical protein
LQALTSAAYADPTILKEYKMNAPIRPDLLGPERLADESARAYRAFRFYRDFGPGRSLDRAWQRFCADQGKEHGPAIRRPGHWTSWSMRFDWVDRAKAYDDLIDEERLTADAELRRKLQEDRSRFEREDQARMEKLVVDIDDVFERLATAPQTEVIQVKRDDATGKKTTTKIKALSGRDLAALAKVRGDTARLTIQGYVTKDAVAVKKDERQIDRVVWRRHNDLDSGHDDTGSPSKNRPRIADLKADPKSDEDKAA